MWKTLLGTLWYGFLGFLAAVLILCLIAMMAYADESKSDIQDYEAATELAINSTIYESARMSRQQTEMDNCISRNRRLLSNAKWAAKTLAQMPNISGDFRASVEGHFIALREGWCDIEALKERHKRENRQ